MITPATMIVNLANKATGWEPVVCSHEEMVTLVKEKYIKGQSKEFIENVREVSKGSFWKTFTLMTPDKRYELYTEAAVSSKGRLVTLRDHQEKKVYEKDYLFLKKFAEAIREESEKELRSPAIKFDGNEKNSLRNANANLDVKGCFCPQCGARCNVDATFCMGCGTKLIH